MNNINDIGFIHCDAQGADNFFFSTATNLISHYKPVILFENNENYGTHFYDKICSIYPHTLFLVTFT